MNEATGMDLSAGSEIAGSRHVVVIYTDAGGGHRATAEALREILCATGGYRVTLVNAYQEVLPHLDLFARYTSRDVEATYNDLILRRGRTGLFCLGFYAGALLNVALLGRQGRRAFAALWERTQPDLVVSVLPVINRLISDSLAGYRKGEVPFSILMTDWAEIGRHVWFPKGDRYYAISGTSAGHDQLLRKRHPSERLFPMSGLLTRPMFLEPKPADIAAARRALGLDPDLPVVCMLYGGYGSWRMLEMAEALRDAPPRAQVVFLCGRNEDLATAVSAAEFPFPTVVKGFTREVHRYMAVADVFVGKTGPLSVSEALAFGLPLLIDRANVLPQEHAVLKWIKRNGAGEAFSTPRQFAKALTSLLARVGAERDETSDAPGKNRAAVQIPQIIAEIIRRDAREETPVSSVDAIAEPGLRVAYPGTGDGPQG
jgi:1,2-diacylglycerol 3-beta-galactosyltransferase